MDQVGIIIEAFGGQTALALAIGSPVQTVHSWKVHRNIPSWRRPAIAAAAKCKLVVLAPDTLDYLHAQRVKRDQLTEHEV